MKRIAILLVIFLFQGYFFKSLAQDSLQQRRNRNIVSGKVSQKVIGTITRTPPPETELNDKSEDAYLPYEGKIVRHIVINQIGFDRIIQDTTRSIKNTITKVANRMHNDTKRWVISDNLFIREGKPLNPYRVADNERYLRDLDFILDSRIYVLPISEESDSVDLLVMTRDVFSFGATLSSGSATRYRFQMQEANLGGMGQRLQVGGVFDDARSPRTGFEYLYQKANLFGSFINATVAYTEINTGRSIGQENEHATYVRLARPLFNPFTRWTGAFEWSRNWSRNNFNEQEDVFNRYQYHIADVWAGYSFGLKKLSLHQKERTENRNRTFVALRVYDRFFDKMPEVPFTLENEITYANRTTVLGSLSFFKQNFYKTRYVLGFGRTEDVPYGYRISFTGGWEKEQGITRPYMGAEATISSVNKNGTFYTYSARLGNYLNEDLTQDALAQFGINRYSRIYHMGNAKVRHQVELNYASQLNQTLKRRLDIRDENGVYGFKPDSLYGAQRIRLRMETVLFTPWKLAGFHLAPIASADFAFLGRPYEKLAQKGNFYSGFSAGLRARNENLIFNTVEARISYYPTVVQSLEHWRATFRVNLRIKYPTQLVTAPATVYDP